MTKAAPIPSPTSKKPEIPLTEKLVVALRQEGDVYRSRDETRPPSARRAMFVLRISSLHY
jgi:hypothetical protein